MVFGTFWLCVGWDDIQTPCVQPASWRTGERVWQALKGAAVLARELKMRWTYSHKNQPFVEYCHSQCLWKLFDLEAVILLFSRLWLSCGSSLLPKHWLKFSMLSVPNPFLIIVPLPYFGVPFLHSTTCHFLDASPHYGRHTASAKDPCNAMPLSKQLFLFLCVPQDTILPALSCLSWPSRHHLFCPSPFSIFHWSCTEIHPLLTLCPVWLPWT